MAILDYIDNLYRVDAIGFIVLLTVVAVGIGVVMAVGESIKYVRRILGDKNRQ